MNVNIYIKYSAISLLFFSVTAMAQTKNGLDVNPQDSLAHNSPSSLTLPKYPDLCGDPTKPVGGCDVTEPEHDKAHPGTEPRAAHY